MEILTFEQWLLANEATVMQQRAGNMRQNIDTSVKFGKQAEFKILNALRTEYGWQISSAGMDQDKMGKIDGIVRQADPKVQVPLPAPIQIKYRDSGDDILMEVVWELNGIPDDLNQLLTGRDMVGKATLYACCNQAGNLIRVRSAKEAKMIARSMLEKLIDSGQPSYREGRNEIRITRDPRDDRKKVNAFIHPDSFSWKADYPIKSIWEEPVQAQPSVVLPQGITPAMAQLVTTALTSGQATMAMPNNMKKLKPLEKYAQGKGVQMTASGNQIVFSKVS